LCIRHRDLKIAQALQEEFSWQPGMTAHTARIAKHFRSNSPPAFIDGYMMAVGVDDHESSHSRAVVSAW
jgi:predicted trehalose synthase